MADKGAEFQVARPASSVAYSRLACIPFPQTSGAVKPVEVDSDEAAGFGHSDLSSLPALSTFSEQLLRRSGPLDHELEVFSQRSETKSAREAKPDPPTLVPTVLLSRRLKLREGVHATRIDVWTNALQTRLCSFTLGEIAQRFATFERLRTRLCLSAFMHRECTLYTATGIRLQQLRDFVTLGSELGALILLPRPQVTAVTAGLIHPPAPHRT